MSINLNVTGNTQPLEAAVNAAINRIRKTPIKITVDDKGATQPLGNMKRGADEFSKSMEAANSRIIAFGASMAIINGVADGFKALVKNVVEVEKALADINVVMNLSTANLEKFSNGLFKTAKETGAAFNVAAEAATEYARQGLTMEESLKRTRDALILTRLTGMDSANAVKALTAAMNTYGDQIKDTTELVSKFAAVDVKFAVSAEDFADAISRTGQAAKSAGVDIDELVGLVTAAQQQTARGGKVIGNSFKTIFTRIGRSDTLNQLENLGIAVRDLEGNTLGAKRILTDLANTFDKLTASQQNQIAQTVGGVFQINVLKAVLSDAAKQNGILASATQISSGATTEAIDKNDQLRQTMSAMATETGLALKELSAQIGEIMLAPGMEKVLNVFKGLAEGANEMLGGGESTGSDFAQGFLKGLGNIITGPGLVVISAVFIKLFAKALIYANQSLRSLIGVTSEAHKQKAIQTSLVTLFGQNAAISKEMLRTDISRTEKERIILGLLKAQVIEANMLNSVSKSVAGGLYTRGYNANLAPRKGRAGGHVPNFADPEREQAARGGYAAGTIRSMNMPGEGSVIYNSAEKVKNFKGMSQPAIMPPHSSKAGKNYQQAFGDVHGFDPYAAGGYIPNFARGGKSVDPKPRIDLSNPAIMQQIDEKTKYLNAGSSKYIGLSASLGPDRSKQTFYVAGGSGTDSGIFNQKGKAFYKKAAMQRAAPRKIDVEFKSLDEKDERKGRRRYDDEINDKLQKRSAIIASGMLKTFGYSKMTPSAVRQDLPKNKMSTVAGHIFEAVTKSVLRSVGAEAAIPDKENELIDLLPNQKLYELFNVDKGKGSSGAEAKINTNLKNVMGFARKIYSSDPTTKTPLDLKALPIKKNKAYGHIPNFADPLSDAIGREKAAGVPVSQIRVGSHPALMGKSNPIGLGVTNTHDEPNGLRDVIGAANGYVPNYVAPTLSKGDMGITMGRTQQQLADQYNKELKARIDRLKKGTYSEKQFGESIRKLSSRYGISSAGQAKVDKEVRSLSGPISKAKRSIGRMGSSLSSMNSRFGKTGAGKAIGSSGGQMALMMGAPMAAGFARDAIGGSTGAAVGGALEGAGSGAAMGMMFGPLGTAIGATVGGLYGLITGLGEAKEAAIAKAKAEMDHAKSMGGSLVSVFREFPEAKKHLQDFRAQYDKIESLRNEAALKTKTVHVPAVYAPGYSRAATTETIKDPVAQKKAQGYRNDMATMVDEQFSKALRELPKDYTFSAAGATKKEAFSGTGEDYIKELKKVSNPKRKTAMYESFVKTQKGDEAKRAKAEKDELQALIIRLNNQKAMLVSQKESAMVQLKIKERYSASADLLVFQEKIMGNLMTDQQKAQNRYNKALDSASEKLESSQETAELKLRQGLMTLIDRSDTLQSAVRADLAVKRGSSPFEAKKIDVTKAYAKKSSSEILEVIHTIELDGKDKLAVESLLFEKKSSNDVAKSNKTFNDKSAKKAFDRDSYFSREAAVKKGLERSNRMNSEDLRSSQKIRGFTEKVAAAERLNAVGPGYQTNREREDFIINEKRFGLESQIKTLRENKSEALGGLEIKRTVQDNREQRYQDMVSGKIELKTDDDWAEYSALNDARTERKKVLEEIEQKIKNINTETKKEIDSATKLLEKEKERLEIKRKHETGPGAFGRGFRDTADEMGDTIETFNHELGNTVAVNFRDGIAEAMKVGLNGADDLGDALMSVASNFLGAIQNAFLQNAANAIVSKIPMPSGNYTGGAIRNYSRGGGVPAMVSDGEYVMNSKAVNKYGGSFMHGLNAGGNIPGFSEGGAAPGSALAANFGGGRGVASGRSYQSKAMSGFFYSQSGNVGIGEDKDLLLGELAEEERQRQAAAAKKAKKKALWRQLIGTALSAGISYGVGGGFGGGGAKGPPDFTKGFNPDGMDSIFGIDSRMGAGTILKRFSGGHIAGKSGIDQIPAMLSEGEYVIRSSSARQIGKPMLDRINAGKFNDGGSVSPINSSSESATSEGSTNNINISINMGGEKFKGGSGSSEGSNESSQGKSDEEQKALKLGERMKQQVVSVIIEEKRPGGLLAG